MQKKSSGTTRTTKKSTEVSVKQQPKAPTDILSHLKIDIKHKNETQKKLTQAIKINDVTICTGPAGTGKSLVSIYMALKLLRDEPEKYNNIKFVKSITQLRDETLPALPGDAMDKMYFQNMSFFDSLHQLIGEKNTGSLINEGKLKFDVIGSFRGRNLNNTILILDETQNINHDNLKTILTRLGDNAKLIILGDPEQIDIKNKRESSLAHLVKKVKSTPINGVEIVEFIEEDIVRHRLTSYFIGLFKEPEIDREPRKKPVPPPIQIITEPGIFSFFTKLFKNK